MEEDENETQTKTTTEGGNLIPKRRLAISVMKSVQGSALYENYRDFVTNFDSQLRQDSICLTIMIACVLFDPERITQLDKDIKETGSPVETENEQVLDNQAEVMTTDQKKDTEKEEKATLDNQKFSDVLLKHNPLPEQQAEGDIEFESDDGSDVGGIEEEEMAEDFAKREQDTKEREAIDDSNESEDDNKSLDRDLLRQKLNQMHLDYLQLLKSWVKSSICSTDNDQDDSSLLLRANVCYNKLLNSLSRLKFLRQAYDTSTLNLSVEDFDRLNQTFCELSISYADN